MPPEQPNEKEVEKDGLNVRLAESVDIVEQMVAELAKKLIDDGENGHAIYIMESGGRFVTELRAAAKANWTRVE